MYVSRSVAAHVLLLAVCVSAALTVAASAGVSFSHNSQDIDCSACECIYVNNLAPFTVDVTLNADGIWPDVSEITTSTIVPGDDYPLKFCVTESANYYISMRNDSWPQNSHPHVYWQYSSGDNVNRNPWMAWDSGRNQGYITQNEQNNARTLCSTDSNAGNKTVGSPNGIGFPIENDSGSTTYYWQTYWDGYDWPCPKRYNSIYQVNNGDNPSVDGDFAWGSAYWLAVGDNPDNLNGGYIHQRYRLESGGDFCRPKLYYDSGNGRVYLQQDQSC